MIKTYTLKEGEKPTKQMLDEVSEAKKKPIVFDEECEELTPSLIKALKTTVGAQITIGHEAK